MPSSRRRFAPGRVVGIYSLSPQTAARARDRLTRRYPGIEVVHRDDKAASDGLLNMVRAADLLIVAIGSRQARRDRRNRRSQAEPSADGASRVPRKYKDRRGGRALHWGGDVLRELAPR